MKDESVQVWDLTISTLDPRFYFEQKVERWPGDETEESETLEPEEVDKSTNPLGSYLDNIYE